MAKQIFPEDLVTVVDSEFYFKHNDDFIPCEKEPIHVPGAIQSHGALMVISASTLRIEYMSDNLPTYFGIPHINPQDFFELRSFNKLLADSQRDNFRRRLDSLRDASKTGAEGFVIQIDTTLFWKSSKYQDALQCHYSHSPPPYALSKSSTSSQSRTYHEYESSDDDTAEFEISFYCSLHKTTRNPNLIVLEFEEYNTLSHQAYDKYFFSMNSLVHSFESAKDTQELCTLAVKYIKTVTGYDRVMMYQFDEDWHGVVIAEEIDEDSDVERYLGIHFPASDIPKQARELYLLNKSRYLVDRSAPTAQILQADRSPTSNDTLNMRDKAKLRTGPVGSHATRGVSDGISVHPFQPPFPAHPNYLTKPSKSANSFPVPYGKPVDMTYCHLRAMSPIHLIYLKNMGVESSMSIGVVVYGVLWGLICCHHFEAHPVTYQARTACAYLGTIISTHLENMINHTRFKQCDQVRKLSEEYWVKHGLKRAPGKKIFLPNMNSTEESDVPANQVKYVSNTKPTSIDPIPQVSENKDGTVDEKLEFISGLKSHLLTEKLREGLIGSNKYPLTNEALAHSEVKQTTDEDWAMAYERFIRATGPAVCKLVSADYSFFMIRDRGIAIPSPAFIPDPLALENYVKFIKASDITEIIVSNHVTKDFEGLTSSRGLAGVIHIPLSDDGKDWLCFCKMEEVAHVTWAGEPKKSMEPGTISGNDSEGHRYLMPRTSFSKWTQIIEGKSPQWNQVNPELLLTIKSVYEESLKTWKNKMLLIDNHQARNKNAELERAKRIAEESDKKKSMLLANVSHEVRTPLHAISGVIELVLDTQLDAEQKQMLVEAKQASNALTSIINDLLDFAKLEAGNLPMQDIPFNLPNLVVETSDMYCKVIEAKGIKFQTVVDSSLPQWIRGDPQRIKQILMNFVSNSCKYTNSGLIRVEAILFAVKEGDNVDIKLRVSDSGIGIPRDKQSLIFEKFEQADNSLSRAVSGTGLGLAIAQNLSVKMGGSIGFSSVQDVGSEFYVIIPFKVVDEHSPAEESIEIISSSATTPEEEIAANVPQPQATPTPHSKLPELNDREVSSGPDEDALSVSRISSTKEESSKPSADSPKKGHASNFRRKKANGKLTPTSSLSPVQLTQDQLHNISDDPNVTLYVLVVEDNVLNQTLILRMLQKLKYSVSVANNGQEAVDIYISKNRDDGHITFNKKGTAISGDVFDVILMDLQMPIMDGFEATQNILQFQASHPPMQELRVAPIIAVTAQAMRGDRELCLSKGMKGYISKPIDFHLFRETLEGIKKEKIKNLRASEPIV